MSQVDRRAGAQVPQEVEDGQMGRPGAGRAWPESTGRAAQVQKAPGARCGLGSVGGRWAATLVRLACLAGLAAALPAAALAQLGLKEGPLIRLVERQVDFGDVSEGVAVGHDFEFWNDGTEPLVIHKVETSCGCTAAAPTDSLIAPGGRSTIRVTFSGRDLNGEITKVVAVYTNDPAEPRIDLGLRASVVPLVRFENPRLDFGNVPQGQTPVLSTLVSADPDLGFAIDRLEGGEDRVEWKVIPAVSPEGDAYLIEARLKPDAKLGRFNDRIVAWVTHPQTERVRLGIKGIVYSCFVPDEDGIRFGSLEAGRRVSRKLGITRYGDQPYEVTGVESMLPFVNASVAPDGRNYMLTVEIDGSKADFDAKGLRQFREFLRITTTDPKQDDLLVEIRGVIRR